METVIQIVLALAFIFGKQILQLIAKSRESARMEEHAPERQQPAPRRPTPQRPAAGGPDAGGMAGDRSGAHGTGPAWAPPPAVQQSAATQAAAHEAVRGRLDELIREAETLLASARIEPATARAAQVLEDYVLPRAMDVRRELAPGQTAQTQTAQTQTAQTMGSFAVARAKLIHLTMVRDAVEHFIAQRRRPDLREAVGDADALAMACYEPVLHFARINRVPLTSAHPVALLTPFDMSTWVGFIPTGVAPLFLPPTFFEDIRWWPAVAHEIGHDFLAATPGLDTRLRMQLGLPSEAAGTRLIDVHAGGGVPIRELVRVQGAWFEEIFCDLFGTMMLGPAYGYSMASLFAEPDAPVRVITAYRSADGRGYDTHPPRHLRVLLCARALRLMGEDEAADEIVDEWTAVHGDQPALWLPTTRATVGVPTEIMVELGDQIITALYREGLDGLDGHSLSDIPGLDHGPHQAAEARRACDQLLAGRAPVSQRARAVVAGAVLAWRREPGNQARFIALARQAIVGVTETRRDLHAGVHSDAYARDPLAAGGARRQQALREAFLLHTMLAPPPSVRRLRPGVRPGFLARRPGPPGA